MRTLSRLLCFLGCIGLSFSTTTSQTEDSWAKLEISPRAIASMPFLNYRIDIYASSGGLTNVDAKDRKYYYAPISLLDPQSAVSEFNNATQQAEMRFRIYLWTESIEKEIFNYLTKVVGVATSIHQVHVIPFEQVILVSTQQTVNYWVHREWIPYQSNQYLEFRIVCDTLEFCSHLTEKMRLNPEQFVHLKLHFTLDSLSSKRRETVIRIENIVSGFSKVGQQFPNSQEVYLTVADTKRLLSETVSDVLAETFSDDEILHQSAESAIYKSLEQFIVSGNTEISEQSQDMWGSDYWDQESHPPIGSSNEMSEAYRDSMNDQERMAETFSAKNNFPKPTQLSRINLAQISNAQNFRGIRTQVTYSQSILSTAVKTPTPSNAQSLELFVTESRFSDAFAQLFQTIADLQRTVQAQQAATEQLNRQNKDLIDENASLKSNFSSEMSNLITSVKDLRDENSSLKSNFSFELNNLSISVNNLSTSMKDLLRDETASLKSNFSSELNNLSISVNNLSTSMKDLRDETDSLKTNFSSELNNLSTSVKDLGDENSSLKSNFSSELNNLSTSMKDLGDENSSLKSNFSSELNNLSILMNNLSTSMKDLGDENSSLKSNFYSELKNLNTSVKDLLTDETASLKSNFYSELNNLNTSVKDLRDENSSLKSNFSFELNNLTTSMKDLKDETDSLKSNFSSELNNLSTSVKDLNDQVALLKSNFSSKLNNLTTSMKDLNDQVASLKSNFSSELNLSTSMKENFQTISGIFSLTKTEKKRQFFKAAEMGDRNFVRAWIQLGLSLDEKDPEDYNRTALHKAVGSGYTPMVEDLLNAGANPNEKDNDGWTPLLRAAWKGRKEVVDRLIQAGANPNEKQNRGWTPLYAAALMGYKEVVDRLIAARANPNEKSTYKWTPLHWASRYGYTEVVKALLGGGASTTVQNNEGKTPRDVALQYNQHETAQILAVHKV